MNSIEITDELLKIQRIKEGYSVLFGYCNLIIWLLSLYYSYKYSTSIQSDMRSLWLII
jgi:hypothetical protein